MHYSFMIFGYGRIPIVSWLRQEASTSLGGRTRGESHHDHVKHGQNQYESAQLERVAMQKVHHGFRVFHQVRTISQHTSSEPG